MFYFKLGTHAAGIEKIALMAGMGVGFLFGEWTYLLTALLIIQGLDILTGVLAAGKDKSISSKDFGEGIKKKLGSWIALILANVIDRVLFGGQPVAVTGVAFAFISGEGISLIENLGNVGVPIPDIIVDSLTQIKSKSKQSEISSNNIPIQPVEKIFVQQDGEINELEPEQKEEEN